MSYSVLLVDDSSVIRSMIARTLDMAGVPLGTVHMAGNGSQALEILKEHWVDLVFLDVNMPVMDGEMTLSHMKEDSVFKDIPVIIVSSEGSAARLERLLQKGASAVVGKPFTPELIGQVVGTVLEGE